MSGTPDKDDITRTDATVGDRKPAVRLRIWPALFILLAQFVAPWVVSPFGTTFIHRALGLALVPFAAAVLLVVWWLAARRVPILDRLAGLLLFAGNLLCALYFWGAFPFAFAVQAVTTGTVLCIAVTNRLPWPLRRWVLAAFMIGCAGVFMALRVDEMNASGLVPVVSWRWSPTETEASAAIPPPKANRAAVLPAQVGPADWPGFRGPARDGILSGTRFSTDWSTPPRELWRRKIGSACSSFAAVGDYVFTQEQRGTEELVTCYEAATGADVWVNRTDVRYMDEMGLGPRATPTFSDGNLHTLGGTGVLQCLDAATGSTVWKRDLVKDVEALEPPDGCSSSPLVVGGLVIEFYGRSEGKSVAAYDRATGGLAWRAGHYTTVSSSPQFAIIAGTPQVLMTCNYGLQSFAPETGLFLIDYPWEARFGDRCVQALVTGDRVMVGSTMGTRMLGIRKEGDAWTAGEEWTSKKFRPHFNDGTLHKGFYYGFDGEKLACIDIATGERRWEGNRYGGQLLLIADMDTLLVTSDGGDVALVPATPEGFTETARFKAVSGKTWNHPTIAHGRLFVRNATEAACFELPLP